MHKFLRTAGFSKILNYQTEDLLIKDVLSSYDTKQTVEDEDHNLFVEFSKEYGLNFGIRVCGIYDKDNLFHLQYYFPYFQGQLVTTFERATVERRISMNAYSAACDYPRLGTTLIFYLSNAADYIRNQKAQALEEAQAITLTGLAEYGAILLPVADNVKAPAEKTRDIQSRNRFYEAPQELDEESMEDMAMQDLDLYSRLSRRVKTEDVYTIVDSFFMPYGLECDYYNLMGDIKEYTAVYNQLSGEKLYQLQVDSNGLMMDILINARDLMGEPAVGRRFKGVIWLQGKINW